MDDSALGPLRRDNQRLVKSPKVYVRDSGLAHALLGITTLEDLVSQAVMAGFLNVAVNTVSQWKRGERRPTCAALKQLHVVKRSGIEPLR